MEWWSPGPGQSRSSKMNKGAGSPKHASAAQAEPGSSPPHRLLRGPEQSHQPFGPVSSRVRAQGPNPQTCCSAAWVHPGSAGCFFPKTEGVALPRLQMQPSFLGLRNVTVPLPRLSERTVNTTVVNYFLNGALFSRGTQAKRKPVTPAGSWRYFPLKTRRSPPGPSPSPLLLVALWPQGLGCIISCCLQEPRGSAHGGGGCL